MTLKPAAAIWAHVASSIAASGGAHQNVRTKGGAEMAAGRNGPRAAHPKRTQRRREDTAPTGLIPSLHNSAHRGFNERVEAALGAKDNGS